MDTSINVSELTQILQCAVCLETVCNPKMLRCNHSYCKRCLDNLLTFSRDGCAVIKCPKGCGKTTKLSSIHTTDDLGVDYMLKGILEKVTAKDKPQDDEDDKITCESCAKNATRYCVYCKMLKCATCRDPHDLVHMITGDSFVPVTFNTQERKLTVLCHEHNTEASYMCCGTKFVCVYCLNRTHVGHQCDTLGTAEKKLKEVLQGEVNFCEALSVGLNETKKDIASAKTNLDEILKINKLKCIEDYVSFLDTEEQQIKNVFSVLTTEHTKPFTLLESTSYFKECLQKEGSNLLLMKNDIMSKIKRKNKMTREVTVSLTDSHFSDENPLGCLNVMHGKRASIDKSRRTFKSEITPELVDQPSLISLRNLRDMLQKACDELNEEMDGREDGEETPSSSTSSLASSRISLGTKESIYSTNTRRRCVVSRRRLAEECNTSGDVVQKKRQRRY